MKEQVGELTVRLDRIEKVRMNATKVYPFDRIEKIGRHIRGIGYEEPVTFLRMLATSGSYESREMMIVTASIRLKQIMISLY
jgi:hypothetical protein